VSKTVFDISKGKKYTKLYYAIGITALVVGVIYLLKPKKSDSSGFVGASQADAFKTPFTKAKSETGYSQLYELSEFFSEPTRKIEDYTAITILKTRVLNGDRYYKINETEWIGAADVKNYKLTIKV
jgi:hypothetical protein